MKPYFSVANILFWLMCWYSLVYITFSRIFENVASKVIRLKWVISILSSFLCKGFISENFNGRRKLPDESDLLHMYVRGAMMIGVLLVEFS